MRTTLSVLAALVVVLSGCGAPSPTPGCVENEVSCSAACAFGCFDGEWVPLRCAVCDSPATIFSGAAGSQCTIRPPESECIEISE